jgi:hypothetical protein
MFAAHPIAAQHRPVLTGTPAFSAAATLKRPNPTRHQR